MKILKDFLWGLCDAIPTAFTFFIVAILVVAFFKQGPNLTSLLAILSVVLWPLVVLAALLFFRRVLTFLFFSLEEFNFFGARGKLKSVEAVINEKALELWEAQKAEKERQQEKEKLESELRSLNESKEDAARKTIRTFKFAEKLIADNSKLRRQMTAMRSELDKLQTQNAILQGNLPKSPAVAITSILGQAEEARDVGMVNPLPVESKSGNNGNNL